VFRHSSYRRPGIWVSSILTAIVIPLFAACGNPSPGVAHVGASTTTTQATVSQAAPVANYTDALKYARCMRNHGELGFPDPNPDGTFSNVPAQSTSQFTRANKTCEHLLPNGGQPTQAEITAAEEAGLKTAQCLRTHGFPNLPNPKVVRAGIGGRVATLFPLKPSMGIDPNSPRFQAALKTCHGH
jgi:hypothetical protein